MNEMVERVARDMWEARRAFALQKFGVEVGQWGDGSIPLSNGIFEEARAAIEAMREPTENQLFAMSQRTGNSLAVIRRIYAAAIEAAL